MSGDKRQPRPAGSPRAPGAEPASAKQDAAVTYIHSRDNAFVKALRRLAQDNTAYRSQGQVWVEGDHLCRARSRAAGSPAWPCLQSLFAFSARGMGASSS